MVFLCFHVESAVPYQKFIFTVRRATLRDSTYTAIFFKLFGHPRYKTLQFATKRSGLELFSVSSYPFLFLLFQSVLFSIFLHLLTLFFVSLFLSFLSLVLSLFSLYTICISAIFSFCLYSASSSSTQTFLSSYFLYLCAHFLMSVYPFTAGIPSCHPIDPVSPSLSLVNSAST